MAKRVVIDCDGCKSKDSLTRQVGVTVDTFTDAAGDTDSDERSFDLCTACLSSHLSWFLSRLSHEEAKDFCERVTRQPFKDRHGRIRFKKLESR